MDQEEYFFNCPHCGAEISFLLDLSIESQDYSEDCEVCCHPIHVTYSVVDGVVEEFTANQGD